MEVAGPVRGGGSLHFNNTSGVNGTLIVNGGTSGGGGGFIQVYGDGTGVSPRVEVFGNGSLDVSGWYSGVNAVRSIEGSGFIFLVGYNLSVGSNNLSTTFSGTLQDGGISGGGGGSLTKAGTGQLTLSKTSTYTGGTTVSQGTLLVTNKRGSATGAGAVQVNAGTLGGTGLIAGAVTVSGPKAI